MTDDPVATLRALAEHMRDYCTDAASAWADHIDGVIRRYEAGKQPGFATSSCTFADMRDLLAVAAALGITT